MTVLFNFPHEKPHKIHGGQDGAAAGARGGQRGVDDVEGDALHLDVHLERRDAVLRPCAGVGVCSFSPAPNRAGQRALHEPPRLRL
jgi:hypothetical protein